MKLPRFAFEIGRVCGPHLRGRRVLVACSGGVDSVALVDVLEKNAERYEFTLVLAHVHHGPVSFKDAGSKSETAQLAARDQAREFVRELAGRYGLDFFERESKTVLRGEESLRDFRRHALQEMLAESGATIVALGHHADDLLETRLMRLIRGTGPRGLRAMSAATKKLVRPFLSASREQIAQYAREQKLEWIEDPSNRDSVYFRNWIRRDWLSALEEKRPGSRVALARSLDLLCEAVPKVAKVSRTQSRHQFHQLPVLKKRALIAAIAFERGARDFGTSKIIEVLKRLDRLEVSRQNKAKFVVGGVEWNVTSDKIVAKADAGLRS